MTSGEFHHFSDATDSPLALAPGNPTLWRGVPVAPIQKFFGSTGRDWKPGKKLPIPCKFCTYRLIRYSSTCYGKVRIDPLMANIRNTDYFASPHKSHKGCLSEIIFPKNESKTCVFVYKRSDHYDGFVPIEHVCDDSGEPLWQSGLTHDVSALDIKLLTSDKSNESIMPSSTNSGDDEDSPKDFIYKLQMHRKSNPANLIAGFLNVNSIRNKFSALQNILCNSYVDLLGVCETKLDDTFPNGQFHVNNSVLHRKDRTSHGGGVAFFVRSYIPHRRRHDLENIIDGFATGLEIIIIEATLRIKERWIYVVGYKPPGIPEMAFYDVFSTLCDLILQESQNIVILGDYNCDSWLITL